MEESPFEENYELRDILDRLEDFFERNPDYHAHIILSKVDEMIDDKQVTAFFQSYDYTMNEEQKVAMLSYAINEDAELRVLSQDRYIFVN